MEKTAEKAASLDSAIEDKFKASLQSSKTTGEGRHQVLVRQRHAVSEGSVKTEREKKEAEDLAKKVPQVQHVVNDIAVKPS